jgi:hypothetical protein
VPLCSMVPNRRRPEQRKPLHSVNDILEIHTPHFIKGAKFNVRTIAP